MSILAEIFAHKRSEVLAAKKRILPEVLEQQIENLPLPVDFEATLCASDRPAPRLIAEVKHRSPSKGLLAQSFDPLRLAEIYARNGAAAISVLTDEKYFGGHLDYLKQIHLLYPQIPLLRKEFIFDAYQLLEARAAGASAVLLITAMLEPQTLAMLVQASRTLHLTPLVEVHDALEMKQAMNASATVIGVNNRNLHDFSVDLETSIHIAAECPSEITLISESGIRSLADARRLAQAGVQAILVGESLVTAADTAACVRELAQQEVA